MKHFDESEFHCCSCGLGFDDMDFSILSKLDIAREYAGVPFVLRSSIRCEAHNKEVGGSSTSSHLEGLAVDIACPSSYSRYRILKGLMMAGFNRFGIGIDFLHADIDTSKPKELMWAY